MSGQEKNSGNPASNQESRTSIFAILGVLGVSYFGLVILVLSLFDTEFNPITDVASLYGVGRFAIAMNLGFFLGGVGILSFALAYALQSDRRKSRLAPPFLFVAGLILIIDSYFTTNPVGVTSTLHGTIHGFGGLFFFITAPLGILLVSRKISRGRFVITLVALVIGFIILGAPDNAGGLAERLILLVVFSSVIIDSLSLYTISKKNRFRSSPDNYPSELTL